jgi:TET-Associated Glycosyltransferase
VQLIIPTRGRTSQQLTLSFLPPELRKRTTIVCPKKEAVRLSCLYADVEIVVQPDPDWTIARKREWIVREWMRAGYDKIIMLDDDLRFATRISPDDCHLREIKGDELIAEFQRIEEKLGPEFPHVGFGQRQGNHQLAAGWKSPARMCYALAYYLPIVTKKCHFDLVEVREDMCVSLQLLLKGYPNAIWPETVVDQRGYDAPGGASDERTVEISNQEARKLAGLFPGYVSVVQRDYKASVPRLEVMVRWQKALKMGKGIVA